MKPANIRLLLPLLFLANPLFANETILPPIADWHGKSEALIHTNQDKWQTPAEQMALMDSPNYADSIKYAQQLVNSDERLHMQSMGKSPQGRDIWFIIASKEGADSAKQLQANKKPTLLIQAGIHSGEIDGKDAGFMLLRDIIHGDKAQLLEQVNVLFIPIFNVDGHERRSPFNRVNQRGPHNMGWRTTAQNLNLNRDYAKADAPEMQHLQRFINTWQPDLYFDVHVTDGEDYQYDLTYGFNGDFADSPAISQWLSNTFSPAVDTALAKQGHKANPLVFGMDSMDFSKGIFGWTAGVRFSNGWGDIRHLPTVLVENHSLKPYKQRVLATYVFLEEAIKVLGEHHQQLSAAVLTDQKNLPENLTLSWKLDMENPSKADFAGIDYSIETDEITEMEYVKWNGKAKTYPALPTFWAKVPDISVPVAKHYYIPPQHSEVINRLNIQGIAFSKLEKSLTIKASELTAVDPEFSKTPFEGHMTAKASFTAQIITKTLPKGTVRVSSSQPLGRLAVALLDPRGPDSYFSWGFFNQMFQRTEYIESYVMAPLGKQMLENDPQLAEEFRKAFKDPKTSSKRAKMQWLYERSGFHDNEYLKYPVLLQY